MSDRPRPFKLRRCRPVQRSLYLLLRAALMIVGMFPVSLAPQVGRWLGRLVQGLDRRHRRVAVKNLERSRGVCPPDAIPEFVDRVYDNLGRLAVEMMMIPKLIGELDRHVRLERFDVIDACLRRGKGAIVVIGHLGNWELVGLGVGRAGYPVNSIARPIENPWIDRFLTRFRTQTGQKIISKYNAVGEMIRVLRRNEILVVQVDQDARSHGVFVEFFGRPASTHRSPALLALKYDAPIIVADIFRHEGITRCILSDPLDPDVYRRLADPVRALTQAYTQKFEEYVRAHADQWFWIHDRWKSAERRREEAPVMP